jgi:hypothetical protein
MLSEFIDHNEWDLVEEQWIYWPNEQGSVNYTHIL